MPDFPNLAQQIDRAFAFAQQQVRGVIERTPGYFPIYTKGGKWKHEGELWTDWCGGFLAGQMWMIAAETGDAWWREQAEAYSRKLESRQHDRDVHDLGFIFMSTYRRWLDLAAETERSAVHDVLITAGRTLALRFQENGQYLRSFVAPESLFIDIMMNVGIIFYAARETGDAALRDVAMRHCQTSRRTLVRGDGSTAHEAIFDRESGECLRQTTHQGYRGDSCWTRGLTWALYGFGTVYTFSQDPGHLHTAQICADFYCDHLPEDGVPPWDFDAPMDGSATSGDRVDSSAGAIAASGLFQLAGLTDDAGRAERYRTVALRAVETLTSDAYLAISTPGWEGVLLHGIYHLHKDLGVDESVMWGEHFFMEALLKARKALTG